MSNFNAKYFIKSHFLRDFMQVQTIRIVTFKSFQKAQAISVL